MFSVWTVFSPDSSTTEPTGTVETSVVFSCPWIPSHVVTGFKNGTFHASYLFETVGPWVLFGLIGGFVIDRGSSKRMLRVTVAITVVAII